MQRRKPFFSTSETERIDKDYFWIRFWTKCRGGSHFFQLLKLRDVSSIASGLAATREVVNPSNDSALDWVKNDTRRFLRAAIKVTDLNRTIRLYTQWFGMKVLKKMDYPERKFSKAVLGFGPEDSHFVLELHQIYGVDKYDIGTAFGHFAIATQNVSEKLEFVRANGAIITQEPMTLTEGNTSFLLALLQDPDGYTFELIQRETTPEPLCQIMFRVADMDRALEFHQKALGMNVLLYYDIPRDNYTVAMVGYGSDLTQTTIIELVYYYNVTEYTSGNGYELAAIGTDDVYKSAKAVKLVTDELGGMITRPPGPIPGINTKITAFMDPDGQKTVLVDNEDYLKELQKIEMMSKQNNSRHISAK